MTGIDVQSFIENACGELRVHLKSGTADIESYLNSSGADSILHDSDYHKLVVSLVRCDIEFQREQGHSPSIDGLVARFPELDKEILANLVSMPEIPVPVSEELFPSRYQKIEKIGAGGIGEVWRVVDTQMKRSLAIKMLRESTGSNWKANQRLQREATLTGSLQHPGIPPVYDKGILNNGSQFFSMKLVEGKTLAQILENQKDDLPFLLGVFEQIAQTLAYAHSRNIIHRDIKPQNIMVGEFGEVQVMDWGMAKAGNQKSEPDSRTHEDFEADETIGEASEIDTNGGSANPSLPDSMGLRTKQGEVMGTPAYMAPEQARGDVDLIGPASDVFALGAVLFEILSGERVYKNASGKETLALASIGDFEPVAQRLKQANVDSELSEICTACLTVDPNVRPADAAYVASAIAGYQSTVQSRLKQAELERSAAEARTSEQRKRTRITAILSAAVATVSLLGALGFAWQWRKSSAAEKQAKMELETRKEINDFLLLDFLGTLNQDYGTGENMLMGATPDPDLKMRTVLDRAAEKVSDRLGDRPQIEAEIRQQLGLSYYSLGEYLPAKRELEVACQLFEQEFGDDNKRYWYALRALAGVEASMGNVKSALPMLEMIHANYVESEGVDSDNSLQTQMQIAAALTVEGNDSEAVDRLKEVIDLSVKKGVAKTELIEVRVDLATALINVSKHDEALKVVNTTFESLDEYVRVDADGEVEIAPGMSNHLDNYLAAISVLAKHYQFNQGQEAAQPILVMAAEISKKCYGEEHPKTLQFIDGVATNFLSLDKFQEACDLLVVNVANQEKTLGPDHIVTLRSKNSLASAYTGLNDFELALKQFLELGEILDEKFPEPVMDTYLNLNNLGAVYSRLGDFKAAEENFKLVAEGCEKMMGPSGFQTLMSIRSVAEMQLRQDKFDEAKLGLLEVLDRADGAFPEDNPLLLRTKNKLVEIYLGSEQLDDANQLIDELFVLHDETENRDPLTFESKQLLAGSLQKLDRFSEADALHEQVVAYSIEKLGVDHSKTLDSFLRMIVNKANLDKHQECIERLDKYQASLDSAKNRWLQLRLNRLRGVASLNLGENELAEKQLLDTYDAQTDFEPVRQDEKNRVLAKTVGSIVELYDSLENTDEVEKWKAKLGALE